MIECEVDEYDNFDEDDDDEQTVHISELACLEEAGSALVWEMDSECPGLTITPDGFVTFDSSAYDEQCGAKWSKEAIKFLAINTHGASVELTCTFVV